MSRRVPGYWIVLPCAASLALGGCGSAPGVDGGSERTNDSSAVEARITSRGEVPRTAIRAFSTAVPETIRLSPPEPLPNPSAEYESLESARDSVEAILRRAVDTGDTAIHVSNEIVRFHYQYVADSTNGYAVRVIVNDASPCPVDALLNGLATAGWVPAYGYSADGPDGTRMGYVTRRYLCVVEGSWDGGDDADSTYVPAPGCEVTATCVLRRDGDEAPRY